MDATKNINSSVNTGGNKIRICLSVCLSVQTTRALGLNYKEFNKFLTNCKCYFVNNWWIYLSLYVILLIRMANSEREVRQRSGVFINKMFSSGSYMSWEYMSRQQEKPMAPFIQSDLVNLPSIGPYKGFDIYYRRHRPRVSIA